VEFIQELGCLAQILVVDLSLSRIILGVETSHAAQGGGGQQRSLTQRSGQQAAVLAARPVKVGRNTGRQTVANWRSAYWMRSKREAVVSWL